MKEKVKALIMDASKIRRVLDRMATEILERNRKPKNLVLIGIQTRGVPLAHRIAKLIREKEDVEVRVGVMDVTRYRDDVAAGTARNKKPETAIPFPVARRDVLLVDDVLFTGRTIRAAMDSLFDLGRAGTIQLLVLIDRGHRELPVRADYVGKVLPTSRRERVKVRLKEIDKADEVLITEATDLRKGRGQRA